RRVGALALSHSLQPSGASRAREAARPRPRGSRVALGRQGYKHILVAVDGTAASERALREAIDLAADQRAEIDIVHVVDLTPYGTPQVGVPVSVYEEGCRAQGGLGRGKAPGEAGP